MLFTAATFCILEIIILTPLNYFFSPLNKPYLLIFLPYSCRDSFYAKVQATAYIKHVLQALGFPGVLT